jgi:hypothetical protein
MLLLLVWAGVLQPSLVLERCDLATVDEDIFKLKNDRSDLSVSF